MISVLYVDDEPPLLEIAKIFLEAEGEFAVDTLTSAQTALALLETTHYDAIISDYQMAEKDGIAFLQALRARGDATPFIIFTGKGREEIVIQALNEGADFYLQKGGEPRSQFAELIHKIKLAVQKRRSDKAILRVNRLYAVLSGVNNTIVRAKKRDELFSEICRITVESGQFTMAWIGIVDHTRRTIEPVAHFGREDAYLRNIHISLSDNPLGQSPCCRAVREGLHIICNDIPREPLMDPGYPEILKRGYHSMGVFPLFCQNTVIGVFQIFSEEDNFFSGDEIYLLDEVASDISFALEGIEADECRRRMENSLQESEEKLAAIIAGSPVPKFVIDRDHRIIFWNRALEQASGVRAAQVIGKRDQWRAFYPEERPTMADLVLDRTPERIQELYAGKTVNSSVNPGAIDVIDFFPNFGDNGMWLRVMASLIQNKQGVTLGAVETLIDVTALKGAEMEL